MSQEQQLDRKDLKIQALLERISQLTTQYESQVSDLRVELTVVSQELEGYRQREAEATEPDVEEVKEDKSEKPAKR